MSSLRKNIHPAWNHEIALAALMLFCMAASTAAQSMGEVVGSIVDQTGAPLPGVDMAIRGVAVRGPASHPPTEPVTLRLVFP